MKYQASSGEKQIEHLKALSNYPHGDFFSSVWLSDKTSGGFHSPSPPGESASSSASRGPQVNRHRSTQSLDPGLQRGFQILSALVA